MLVPIEERPVHLRGEGVELAGDLAVPADPIGIVTFAHGSGSGRTSPRNRMVAHRLNQRHLATLLVDLLTEREQEADRRNGSLRFDVDLLARRLVAVLDAVSARPELAGLPEGLYGASTGAAAALVAAVLRPGGVRAVVSRGGRPDLAGSVLGRVHAPTLLIVGGADLLVLDLNRAAQHRIPGPCRLEVIPGAGHLFEEPGALDQVARLAGDWLVTHLGAPSG